MHNVERAHNTVGVTNSHAKAGIPHENKGLPHGLEDEWRDLDRWEDEGGRYAGTRLGK